MCPYGLSGGVHPVGARSHGHQYNAAEIPQALAEEVADHAYTTMYKNRIRDTKPRQLSKEEEDEFNQAMAQL